jgi:hypothetical protein
MIIGPYVYLLFHKGNNRADLEITTVKPIGKRGGVWKVGQQQVATSFIIEHNCKGNRNEETHVGKNLRTSVVFRHLFPAQKNSQLNLDLTKIKSPWMVVT